MSSRASGEYSDLIAESEVPERRLVAVRLRDHDLCILKSEGEYFVFSNVCTHVGGRLSDGKLGNDLHVICPFHRAVFDIRDGRSLSFPRRGIMVYPVAVRGGVVKVKLEGAEERWQSELPSLQKTA